MFLFFFFALPLQVTTAITVLAPRLLANILEHRRYQELASFKDSDRDSVAEKNGGERLEKNLQRDLLFLGEEENVGWIA